MGLDMYLSKKTYIGANFEHNKVAGTIEVFINKELVPINFKRVTFIEEEIGYWRKANAIHGWFAKHVGDGGDIDNCRSYYVPWETLEQLQKDINEVLSQKTKKKKESKAMELLPPSDGFYFGSQAIDEYYWEKLDNTLNILEEILSHPEEYKRSEIMYMASW
jgi:hypothetical protein